MAETEDNSELLFFDTFSHEEINDNLDLVQFPKPVYITQVRIIPLGARVQADFPGGVRLGATNPSKFDIDFFVNDLGMTGASSFENLGHLQYNQNDCIHLQCSNGKIPTDGLVLRGWYNTITLAVYGVLTNALNETIASPTPQQCEAAVEPEEILDAEAPSTSMQAKAEEWKEPVEIMPTSSHTKPSSDYEPEDIDYNVPRKHYHQHSGEERERRSRKISNASERSRSHSPRKRTHSGSNDEDYIRSKHSRDWSRSPEYSRRSRRKRSERSRSEAEEPHSKWPRTPPTTIDSPTRPRSPDTLEYEDDDPSYKVKSRSYLRSEEASSIIPERVSEDEETTGTPVEQYEPILSDDEMIGVDDDVEEIVSNETANEDWEIDIQTAAKDAEPAIDSFNPFTMSIRKYEGDLYTHFSKELENLRIMIKKFELQITPKTLAEFREPSVSVEDREKFVFLSDQLISQLTFLLQDYRRRNFVLKHFFKNDEKHLEQMFNILQMALSYEVAYMQPQPAFKIRHIKIGARLAELLSSDTTFIEYMLFKKEFDVFQALFDLYHQQFMSLSIKLMILKAVYAMVDTRTGLKYFLNSKVTGYRMILQTLEVTHLTRSKYALQAIIKKLNLYEALESIKSYCEKLFVLVNYYPVPTNEPFMVVEQGIEEVINALSANSYGYLQPRRFLPVSRKFEIIPDPLAQKIFSNALHSYFKQQALAESLVLILSNAESIPATLYMRSLDLLQALMTSHVGLDYLVDDCFDITKLIIGILLGIEDLPEENDPPAEEENKEKENPEDLKNEEILKTEKVSEDLKEESKLSPENLDSTKPDSPLKLPMEIKEESPKVSPIALMNNSLTQVQKMGIELSYKIQTKYHLDAIVFLAATNDYDSIQLASHLHALYSQTCVTPGRQHTVEIIGLPCNLQIFMDLIKKEQRLQAQRQITNPGCKYKSPVLSYAVDIVDCCVRYCEQLDYLSEHSAAILELAKNHETFEPSVSAVLQEMYVYLKPVEVININSYDDITPLIEIINRSLEYITTFPGDLIMALRILRHMCKAPKYSIQPSETELLKYRFVALQFYGADGIQILIQILEKLCSYFEQPGLHTPSLMTIQGLYCCQIILPTLQVLREILSYAIMTRDKEFKDLTAIDHLMKTYFLLHYYPAASQAANEVQQAKQEIIQTFLAYTQPREQDEESLSKSLWTLMIREILKNIEAPCTFIPGLLILVELLPLPLPMPLPANTKIIKDEAQRLITERKLWCAHLHPQSSQIAKLIETIVPTSFPQLSDLMIRVCIQLSDLAPNLTLLITKTLTDLVSNEFSQANNNATNHLARLLTVFARLSSTPSLKSSALSILSGKLWDLFNSLLTSKDPDPITMKCQVYVHRILESFLDTEISLVSSNPSTAPALNLASALPPKELIPKIAEAILTNLFNVEITHEVSALSIRNLVILTEHDISFYHLSLMLKQKSSEFQQWLEKVIVLNEKDSYNSNIESLVLLLRSLSQCEDDSSSPNTLFPPRTLKLSLKELANLIGLPSPEAANGTPSSEASNPLQRICNIMEKHKEDIHETLINDGKQLLKLFESLGSDSAPENAEEDLINSSEPILPQAESIVSQYDGRPLFSPYDKPFKISQLSINSWVDTMNMENLSVEDFKAQFERIPCDLNDLANECLPPETNLTTECKRVLHLSASPQSNREKTPAAPCFRTRRVEVEPSTGRPEKKVYVTPVRGRGYTRAPQSRGDLFRSRPPNTSRPPSLHVDDFLALETCGAQPTGPTGYNKIPCHIRGARVARGRGSRLTTAPGFRKPKLIRTASPSTWTEPGAMPHYRPMPGEQHFGDPHYPPMGAHFIPRARGRGLRGRASFMR